MLFRFTLFLSCIFSLSCSDVINSQEFSPSLADQVDQRRGLATVTLTKIASAHETGKFSFSSTALLENGKILAVGYDGENLWNLRVSNDKGQTWEIRPFTEDTSTFPDSVYFADDRHGWIGGAMGVFRTTDGGNTWEVAKMESYLRWTKLNFFGQQTGYLAGKHNIKGEVRGEIWKTNDGGKTWKVSYISKKWDNPFSIVAISADTACAVFNEKHLIRTSNAGKTWEHIESFDYRTSKLRIDKIGRLWAVGYNGVFFVSSDHGSSWHRPQMVPADNESTNWHSIVFASDKVGFVVGDKGSLALTRDGGERWERIQSNVLDDLYDVFTNVSFGIIKGSDNIYRLDF